MRKKNNKCSINGCNNLSTIVYYTYPICYKHWEMYCKGTFNLKKHFNIPEPTHSTFLTKELQKPLTEPTTMRNKAIIQKRLQ